jgi:hypothetical protein
MEIYLICVYNNNNNYMFKIKCDKWFLIIVLSMINLFSKYITYQDVSNIIIKECNLYPSEKVNPYIVRAIMFYESRVVESNKELFDTQAISCKGCIGLMQISEIGLQEYNQKRYLYLKRNDKLSEYQKIIKDDLFNPKINILIGIWIYVRFLENEKGNIKAALNRYSHHARNYADNVCMKAMDYMMKKLKHRR